MTPVLSDCVPHAYDRWVTAILAACALPSDPRTVLHWARGIGVSESWLRAWCYAAGVTPKASLDLARLLRLVLRWDGDHRWNLLNMLDIVDERTLHRLVARGSLHGFFEGAARPTIDRFLARQRYVADAQLLCLLRQRVRILEGTSST